MKTPLTKGNTLIEIVIAVAVFSLIAAAVGFVFTRALTIYQGSDQKKEALQDAQIAKEWLVRDLDSTTCVMQAGNTTLKLDNKAGIISYYLDTSQAPYKLIRSVNSVNYTLAENIDSLAFKYFNAANQQALPDIKMVEMALTSHVGDQTFGLYTVAPEYTMSLCTGVDAYGWTINEDIQDVAQTPDGGYIVVGSTSSFTAFGADILLMKLSAFGDVEWVKTYGQDGNITDYGKRVLVLSDGYLVAGETVIDTSNKYAVLMRTDLNGNITGTNLWYKVYKYSTVGYQLFVNGLQDSGDGFIVAGSNFKSTTTQMYNIFVFKVIRNTGAISYSKSYGDTGVPGDYCAADLQKDAGGNYLMVGTTDCQASGANKILFMKINPSDLNVVPGSAYTYMLGAGTTDDYGYRILLDTVNGGYLIGAAKSQTTVIKINNDLSVNWAKYFTGSNYMSGLAQVAGGYLIMGFGGSPSAAVLIKINTAGTTVPWEYSYGGSSGNTYSRKLLKMALQGNEAYIVAGETGSYGKGFSDLMLFRTNSSGTIDQCSSTNFVKTTPSFNMFSQTVTAASNSNLVRLDYSIVETSPPLTIIPRNVDISTSPKTTVCPCQGCS